MPRRKKKPAAKMKPSAQGCRPGYLRRTVIVNEDQYDALKQAAWYDRRSISDMLEEALGAYLKHYKVKSKDKKKR